MFHVFPFFSPLFFQFGKCGCSYSNCSKVTMILKKCLGLTIFLIKALWALCTHQHCQYDCLEHLHKVKLDCAFKATGAQRIIPRQYLAPIDPWDRMSGLQMPGDRHPASLWMHCQRLKKCWQCSTLMTPARDESHESHAKIVLQYRVIVLCRRVTSRWRPTRFSLPFHCRLPKVDTQIRSVNFDPHLIRLHQTSASRNDLVDKTDRYQSTLTRAHHLCQSSNLKWMRPPLVRSLLDFVLPRSLPERYLHISNPTVLCGNPQHSFTRSIVSALDGKSNEKP